MKKRLIPLLLVFAIVLLSAPAAMATHCERCRPLRQDCIRPTVIAGWEICYWDDFNQVCVHENECAPHEGTLASAQAFSAEYAVASVERLDEPNAAAHESLVASLQTPNPATR